MSRVRPSGIAAVPVVVLAALTALTACNDASAPLAPDATPDVAPALAASRGRRAAVVGAVYTSTNAAGGNQVLAFPRRRDGTLGAPVAYATGGTGAGAGLGSQGAVTLSPNGRWLLVANAGSNSVSVFAVDGSELTRTDVEPSGGTFPVSIAVRGNLVYVLNGQGTTNVTGFRLSNVGALTPIDGATSTLSAAATGPAQAAFSPDGRVLVVTEKATNRLTAFTVGADGRLATAGAVPSATATPFGFAFDPNGYLIAAEAAGGAAGASVLSSYDVTRAGAVTRVSPSVATTQSAACWVLLARDGSLAYTTNAASGTISAFDVGVDGRLTLRHAVAASTGAGSSPLDMALSRDGRFLYVVAPGNATTPGTVRAYAIRDDGTLAGVSAVDGIPGTAYGLAAR
jgi:6-phosphogluconolactonase